MKLNDSYFLSPAHLEIAKARYFLKDNDKYIEHDIDDVFNREVNYIYKDDSKEHRDNALKYRREKKILPAGRPLAQAGTKCKNLNNCYILGFQDDTREAISEFKRQHFSIMSQGGGIGANFSVLRPEGSILKTSLGHSSGAVGYITDISYQSSNTQQPGNRSGANLALLEDWHPDLYEFIIHKKNNNWENVRKFAHIFNEDKFNQFQWNNHYHWQMMNVSVGLSDKFMNLLFESPDIEWRLNWKNEEWFLWKFKNKNEELILTAPNKELAFYKASSKIPYFNNKNLELIKGPYHLTVKEWFHLLSQAAWEDGCPGIIFIDRAKQYHNLEYYAPISCTNPCQPGWATILTTGGIKTINDINIGDIIWSGKQWTKVTNKWSTGIKEVFSYATKAGVFYGTCTHKIISKGLKIEVGQATSIDPALNPDGTYGFWQWDIDIKSNPIKQIEFVSKEEVFDLTVDCPEHTYWTDGLLVSNCGEVYGSINSVCNLSSLVLPSFWKNNKFDFKDFKLAIQEIVRGLDNIIDLSYCNEKDIDEKARLERRIGLGVTGTGELLLLAGLKYSSQEGRNFISSILEVLRNEAYNTSIELAKERGSFPIFDNEKYQKSLFVQTLPAEIKEKIAKFGIRNGVLLAEAPNGSVGTMSGYSQGCEPYFAMAYQRNSKVGSFIDGSPCFRQWLKDNEIDYSKHNFSLAELKKTVAVPDFFEEAHNISVIDHIKMQAVFAQYFDQSVSKTLNMPNSSTIEDVIEAYKLAYKLGIKSTTIYRDGSKQQILEHIKTDKKINIRPKELDCDIHHVSVRGEKWVVLVGKKDNLPYELFAAPQNNFELSKNCKAGRILKEGHGKFSLEFNDFIIKDIASLTASDEQRSITRLLSLSLRNCESLVEIIDQLEKAEGNIVDFSKAIIRVLKKYLTSEEIKDFTCPKCGSHNMILVSGCPQCLDCSFSKCS